MRGSSHIARKRELNAAVWRGPSGVNFSATPWGDTRIVPAVINHKRELRAGRDVGPERF